ncbi:MAG TPA: PDZ domain-containing protein [Gemmatimonadaceae bacterium]|nr:PDZ domain-containing protein [Gemmatimonadaceae bacterium]
MKSRSLIACAAALALSTEFAMAQKPSPAPAPAPKARISTPEGERCISTDAGRIECRKMLEGELGRGRPGYLRGRLDSALMKRAAVGLQISSTGTRRDTIGVFVSSVTPKGPAENAGIIEGDRIVSINGVDLRVSSADAEDSYASGLATRRLQREVGKLAPGARVSLRVWSGGRVRDVQVTAGRASDLTRARAFNLGGFPGGTYIYRDGFPEMLDMPEMIDMPPMPPMAPIEAIPATPPMVHLAPVPSAPRMRVRDLPRMRRLDLDHLPRMNIEQGERLRMLAPPGVGPRRIIRI